MSQPCVTGFASRFVCKHADPVMATGWHMVLGGLVLAVGCAGSTDAHVRTRGIRGMTHLHWFSFFRFSSARGIKTSECASGFHV